MSFRLVTHQDKNFDERSRKQESALYREVSAIIGDTGHVSVDGDDVVSICLASGEHGDRGVDATITRTTSGVGKWDIKITNLHEVGRDYFATGLSDNDLLLAVVVAHITLTSAYDDFPWGMYPILGMGSTTFLEGSANMKNGEVVGASGRILSYNIERASESFRGSYDPELDEPLRPRSPTVVSAAWYLSDGLWGGNKVYFSVVEEIDRMGGLVKVFDLRMSKRPWWKRWLGIGVLECADEVMSDYNITDAEYREAGASEMKIKREVKEYKDMTTTEFVKEFGEL